MFERFTNRVKRVLNEGSRYRRVPLFIKMLSSIYFIGAAYICYRIFFGPHPYYLYFGYYVHAKVADWLTIPLLIITVYIAIGFLYLNRAAWYVALVHGTFLLANEFVNTSVIMRNALTGQYKGLTGVGLYEGTFVLRFVLYALILIYLYKNRSIFLRISAKRTNQAKKVFKKGLLILCGIIVIVFLTLEVVSRWPIMPSRKFCHIVIMETLRERKVDRLIRHLNKENLSPYEKQVIVTRLRKMGKIAIPKMLKMMMKAMYEKKDWELVYTLGYDLEKIQPKLAFTELEHACKSNDWVTRYMIIGFIGGLDYVETIPLLVEALDDPHPWVRSSAITGLSRIDKETRLGALKEITLGGDKSIMLKLIDLLSDEDAEVRSSTISAIRSFCTVSGIADKSSIPKLIMMLDDKNEDCRREAKNALRQMIEPTFNYPKFPRVDRKELVRKGLKWYEENKDTITFKTVKINFGQKKHKNLVLSQQKK